MTTNQKFLHAFALATAATLLATGCKSNTNPAPIISNGNSASAPAPDNSGVDPAAANLAGGSTQVLGQSSSYTPQQQGESYSQAPAPQQGSGDYAYNNYNDQQEVAGEEAVAQADQAPPPLPEYEQPPAPDPNYLWTPGYWGYNNGYYWNPGVWVAPPYQGALWTPPYWGYYGGRYGFHHGYWGRHVGFYGGIDYGFGYIGIGYFGGYWRGNNFYYNRAVTRVGPGIGNVYDHNVVYNNVHYGGNIVNRVSYNGGRGGIAVAPRPAELAAIHESHVGAVPAQREFRQQAAQNPGNAFAQNHGRPAQAAFARPEAQGRPGVNPQQQVQQQAQRNQQMQQRTNELQQRNAQVQQHNTEVQQRNTPVQQHNNELQQRNQLNEQHNQQAAQAQQQRTQAVQQRTQAVQQHTQAVQQRTQAQEQHNAVQQQRQVQPQAARPQPAAQPHVEQHAAPAARPAAPAPQPHVQAAPAPHPAPAAPAGHPEGGHPEGGGGEHHH